VHGALSRAILCAGLLALLPMLSEAGSGRYDPATGTWDIIVSLSWEASDADFADIEERFTQASELLYDVTDGAMRFGRITIFDGGVGKEFADVDITLGSGGASAPSGPGVFGVSFHLFTDDDIYPSGAVNDTWQTIVHEFGHYALNLLDEYTGSGGPAECVVPTPATACIMDNYKNAGYADASELCWDGNHDPDGDTAQEEVHGQSCWTRVAELYSTIAAPGAGPDEAAPAGFSDPVYEIFDDPLVRVALVLDTSGSMNGPGGVSAGVSRLQDLQTFASQFIDVMGFDDVELGIVTYASNATEEQSATLLDDAAAAAAAKGNLPTAATGQTSIGRGMSAGRDLLTASAAPGPLVMILMTDGFHNHPPGDASLEPLAVVPSLLAEDIHVHTIGLGDSVNEDLLRDIADATGAMFWKANNSLQLEPVLAGLGAVVRGGSLLDSAQLQQLPPGTVHISSGWLDNDDAGVAGPQDLTAAPQTARGSNLRATKQRVEEALRRIWVEEGNREAAFSLGWAAPDADLDLILRSPSGEVITGPADQVRRATGPRYVTYVVANAESGWWDVAIRPRANPTGTAYAFQPTVVNLAVTGYADGELLEIDGAPVIRVVGMARDGIAVTDASVTALMTDPGGATRLIQMFDDGDSSHGDAIGADGLYSGLAGNLAASGNGIYRFEVSFSVDPTTATVVPGEEPPPTVDNRTLHSVRRFERSFPVAVAVNAFPGIPQDSDGDGIPDPEDGNQDTDGDGNVNRADPDSDGDDHPDRDEGTADLDCDGVPNFLDTDADGDGIPDASDLAPFEDTGCGANGDNVCCDTSGKDLLLGLLIGLLFCVWWRRWR
jgi:uncharacterized protein YegL